MCERRLSYGKMDVMRMLDLKSAVSMDRRGSAAWNRREVVRSLG